MTNNYSVEKPATTPTCTPAIAYIRRRARVTEAHARVIASLHGLPLPDAWEQIARPAAQAVATLAWRVGR